MRHFRMSFVVALVLLSLATWWGYSIGGSAGAAQALLIASILAVMEVSATNCVYCDRIRIDRRDVHGIEHTGGVFAASD